MASRTRRRSSKSIPASDTWQLQGGGLVTASAAANILPPELALPRMPLAPGVMSQSGWLPRGWAWWPLRGGGATGGVPSRTGGRSWDRTAPTEPRGMLPLRDEGGQAPWQAAAPGSRLCLLAAHRKNQAWRRYLFAKVTAALLSAALCHLLLPNKETHNRERNH